MKRKRKIASVLVGMMASVGIISSINIPETSSLYRKEREIGYLSYASTIAADNGVSVGIDLMNNSTPKEARFKLSLRRIDSNSNTKYLIYVPKACKASNLTDGIRVGEGNDSNKIEFADDASGVQNLELSCVVGNGEKEIKISLNSSVDEDFSYGSYTLDLESYVKRLQYNKFKNYFSAELGGYVDFNDDTNIYVKYLNYVGINPSTIVSGNSWLGIEKNVDTDVNGYYTYEFENLKGYAKTLEYSTTGIGTKIYFSENLSINKDVIVSTLKDIYGYDALRISRIIEYFEKCLNGDYSKILETSIPGVEVGQDGLSYYIVLSDNMEEVIDKNLIEIELGKYEGMGEFLGKLKSYNGFTEELIAFFENGTSSSEIIAAIINENVGSVEYFIMEDMANYLFNVVTSDEKKVITITRLDKTVDDWKVYIDKTIEDFNIDYGSGGDYSFVIYVKNSLDDLANNELIKYLKQIFEEYDISYDNSNLGELETFSEVIFTVKPKENNYANNSILNDNLGKSADNSISSLKLFGKDAIWNEGLGRFEVSISSDKLQIASDDLETVLPTGATLKAETLELNSDITEYEYKFTVVAENGDEKTYIVVITKIKDDTPSSGDTTGGEEELPVCSEGQTENCKPKDETTGDATNDGDDTCVDENCGENAGNIGTGEEDADKGQVSDAGSGSTEDGGDAPTLEVDGGSDATGSQDNAANPVVEDTNLDSAVSSDLGVDNQL